LAVALLANTIGVRQRTSGDAVTASLALLARQAGADPAATDYIVYLREPPGS
jgi:hypothetical protein